MIDVQVQAKNVGMGAVSEVRRHWTLDPMNQIPATCHGLLKNIDSKDVKSFDLLFYRVPST